MKVLVLLNHEELFTIYSFLGQIHVYGGNINYHTIGNEQNRF